MTDPIADLLTRIRNAVRARHDTVTIPSSRVKKRIAEILKERGFISQVVEEKAEPQANLKIFLKYDERRNPAIEHLKRISKPGGRVYIGYRDVHSSLKGMGLKILSTPKGILSDDDVRRKKVGGEFLCEIW